MQTDLITKVYFNEHLTHSCVGMPQGLQALLFNGICKQKLFEQSFVKFLNACQMSNIRDTRACSVVFYISMKLSCITFQIVPHLIETVLAILI